MGFVDRYTKDVWKQRRMIPQYPPAGLVSVGDVLERRDGVWEKHSSLASMGFTPKLQEADVGPVELQSTGSVSMETKAEGSAPSGVFTSVIGEAEAGVAVTFTADFGYLLSLADVTEQEMTNIEELVAFIRATRRWNWDLSFLIVSSVYNAKMSTVLTSSKEGSTAILKAKADVRPGGVSVADLAAGFEYAAGSGLNDKWVAVPSMTPLFRGRRITLREVIFGGGAGTTRASVSGQDLQALAVDSFALEPLSELIVEVEEYDPTAM